MGCVSVMLKHLILNYMIELTTGIAFILSSLYGGSVTTTEAVNVQANTASTTGNEATITVTSDRKAI